MTWSMPPSTNSRLVLGACACAAATYAKAGVASQEGNQKFGMWDKNIHFYQSFDYFKTSTVLVPHGNRFLFGDHSYLFVAAVCRR